MSPSRPLATPGSNYLLPDILWRIIRPYYRLSPVQIYDISFDILGTPLDSQRRRTEAKTYYWIERIGLLLSSANAFTAACT